MFIYMAVFLVALAFALLSIYIAKILIRISALFSTLGQTVANVENELDQTVIELESLIVETAYTARDVEGKLLATDSLFTSIDNVGQATSMASGSLLSKMKNYSEDPSLPGTKPFVRAIQWSEFATILFHAWGRGKKHHPTKNGGNV